MISFPRALKILYIYIPAVQEYQLQVHAGAEHKHILVQLDLGDCRRRQRVADRHEAQILDATVAVAVLGLEYARFQVARTVNDLGAMAKLYIRNALVVCLFIRANTLSPPVISPAFRLASTHFMRSTNVRSISIVWQLWCACWWCA